MIEQRIQPVNEQNDTGQATARREYVYGQFIYTF